MPSMRSCRVSIGASIGIVAVVVMLPGCAYLNGDAMWLSTGQKGVAICNRFSTFGDVEYSFNDDNLPFRFNVSGYHEFGHVGHSTGVPDFSKGGYIATDSVLRFSVEGTKPEVRLEFLVSNGVVQVVGCCGQECQVERRKGSLPSEAKSISIDERWREIALGRLVSVGVWHSGCSVQIHRLGEYGVVYNYTFPSSDDGRVTLCISDIQNLRWFHWPGL